MSRFASTLKSIHDFFAGHSFYPVVLSSVLSLSLFLGRVLRSESLEFRNLVWNLGLAWVPYLASLCAASFFQLTTRQRWLLFLPGGLWLIFFPNAPYIITDFLHLYPRSGIPIWYDILMLASFSWSGLFLAITSLRTMHGITKELLGWLAGWAFAGAAFVLGGLGIYLGRFSRFNSWDLIFNPLEVLLDVAVRIRHPLSNLRFFGFTFLFALFLWVVYFTFVSVQRANHIEQ